MRFGPFELHPESGQLFKSGIRIRLPGQSVQILHHLLEHAGELVTREQLRDKLWGAGTFVEFEHSLNVAVNRLRRGLNDSAEHPRYVETITGRGYRFVGPIEAKTTQAAPAAQEIAVVQDRAKATGRQWKIVLGVAGAAVVLLSAAILARYLHSRPRHAVMPKGTIVLAAFRNTTGDKDFDGTLSQGLAVELAQSPYLSLLSDGRILSTLRLMGRSPADSLTPALARDVCERTASSAVLAGSIAPLGREYVVALDAETCGGEFLDKEQEQTKRKEDVLQAITRITSRFRQRAGEPLATIREHGIPLEEATTPSLEALRAYTTARKEAFTTGFAAAVPLLHRAVELDPQFAMAHAFLGRVYADIGDSDRSRASTQLAYRFRDRASDREKFFITFSYDRQVTGDLESAARTLTLFMQTYPRASEAHSLLSGFTGSGRGRYDLVIDEAQKTIALDPDLTPAYLNLATGYLARNRFEDAKKTLAAAAARKLEIPDAIVFEYIVSFLRNDNAAMKKVTALSKARPDVEDWVTHCAALAAVNAGHLSEARAHSKHAIELAANAHQSERAGIYQAAVAYWEAMLGDSEAARQHAHAALRFSSARDVQFAAALSLRLSGEEAESQALAKDLQERFPADTQVAFIYLPALRAAAALNRGHAAQAIAALEKVRPYEQATPGTGFIGFFGGYFPSYLRGLAYLADRRGAEAVREFHEVSTHPGIVALDPSGALARLQTGRAYAMCGDRQNAKAAYDEFFALWKASDPNIPLEERARAEYQSLCDRDR